MSLGIELDLFPESQARAILVRHLHDSQSHREFLSRNADLFPGELVTSLETALTAKRYFEPIDNYFFYSPETLRESLQAVLATATDFTFDPFVRYLIAQINFGTEWDKIIAEELRWPDLVRAERIYTPTADASDDMIGSKLAVNDGIALVSLGFLRFTQYILLRQAYLEDVQTSSEIDEQDGYLFARRVRNIQQWRLSSKKSSINRSRFEQIGKKLNSAIIKDVDAAADVDNDQLAPTKISELINEWQGGEANTGER